MTTHTTDYCTIPLTQGQFAIVDAADFEWLNQWKWFACWAPTTCSFYAARQVRVAPKRQHTMQMHRQILNLSPGDGILGDHIDGNTLNNRRGNLRRATHAQNARNQKTPRSSSSGLKGASWDKSTNKWLSQIMVNRKNIHLGRYATAAEAHAAYCAAAKDMHQEFARTGGL